MKFYAYSWSIDEEETEVNYIRIYGVDEAGKNICVRVNDFTPYVYVELPDHIKWDQGKIASLGDKIADLMKDKKPLTIKLFMKKKLYYAHLDKNKNDILYPFALCSFSSTKDRYALTNKLRNRIYVSGIGSVQLKVHEANASPILQLCCCAKLPSAGWIEIKNPKQVADEEKMTLCDFEFFASWKKLKKPAEEINFIGNVKVMSFDIEVNSHNPSAFPNAENREDRIFQISCIFQKEDQVYSYLLTLGDPFDAADYKIIRFPSELELLIGFTNLVNQENPNVIVGFNILGFDIQYMIDRAKQNFNDIFLEFNKMGFLKGISSNEKVVKWYSSARGHQEYRYLDAEGRLIIDIFPIVQSNYKLSNYKLKTVSEHILKDTKDDLDAQGIFRCYRIGIQRDSDGNYNTKARRAMSICGKYCIKDSILVLKLYEKMQTFVGLAEMANIFNVTPFDMYTKGQQVKVFSQVYKHAMYNNIVINKDAYQGSDSDRYTGAHVFEPIPGVYDQVVPFDFGSLYPSIMIAYNICYSTMVLDESIPDLDCHVIEFENHFWCEHDPKFIRRQKLTLLLDQYSKDITKLREKLKKMGKKESIEKKNIKLEIEKKELEKKPYMEERRLIKKAAFMCEKRRYRFLKSPRGVIPTILQNSLDARKKTRGEIKKNIELIESGTLSKESINELTILNNILEKRQLSYKVSSNSMYGSMGVTSGYLPFMPGAMSITFLGRLNIEKVAKVIPEKFGGELVYGDTDSNYIRFPHLKTAEEIWDHAVKVSAEVSALFPKPLILEFEKVIYWRFFILTKKRYMYTECKRDGIVGSKVGKKGVLLARRDNSAVVKRLYEKVITKIFNKTSAEEILIFVLEEINNLFRRLYPSTDFVVTKGINDSGDYKNEETFETIEDKNGKEKFKIGSYTVSKLSTDVETAAKEMIRKKAGEKNEFYLKSLPAQVQLAEKMKRRGKRVDKGSRLEFVITTKNGHDAKQGEKIEQIDYFNQFSRVLSIDYLYYLKLLINPLDQLLNITFCGGGSGGSAVVEAYKFPKNFVLQQYRFRYKVRDQMLKSIKTFSKSKLNFVN